jgi:hypothetical protein
MELLDITNREKSLGDEMREYAQYADKAIAHQEPIYNKYYTITDLQGKNELVLSRDDNWEMTKGRLADKVYISGDAADKFTKYENIQDKLDKRFSGCITLEKIVDAFIEFYDQQERDEPLAECMLIVNDNVRKYEQWEKAEKNGLLVKLPCRIGGTVYHYCEEFGRILEYTISYIGISAYVSGGFNIVISGSAFEEDDLLDDFEEDIYCFQREFFQTFEEAELALTKDGEASLRNKTV